ncbi:MAG: ABC transporter substrate-binding protein [Colwellia sp.]|nr:ABC transporter substrate-binding protein [Colwellia sp.]
MTRVILIFLLFYTSSSWAINITLLNADNHTSPFWQRISSFAQDAADDLGINLTVIYSDNHYIIQLKNINKLTKMAEKPDYVIFMPYRDSIVRVFDALEQAKIPFVTLERVYSEENSKQVGLPREKYKYWLGEMFHDNIKAGKTLSKVLVSSLLKDKPKSKKYKAVAITGDNFSSNFKRWYGLKMVVNSIPNINISEMVRANWDRQQAQLKYKFLREKYIKIDIVFTSSDEMALGVMDAVNTSSLMLNKDIVIGGFDWIPEALIAIKNGKLTASVGGHFMQGAWAIVKIYDHHQKLDVFKKGDNSDYVEMLVADASNIDIYLPLAQEINFTKINFAQFSLTHQDNKMSELGYQFSLERFMKLYNEQ